MKNEIRNWIDEIKQMKNLDEIQKRQVINFNNYFKYSGKIEEEKKVKEFKINKIESKKIVTNDPIVQFYFDNPGYTLEEVGRVFEVKENTVKKRLNKYFKNNKNLKNGESIRNE